MICLSSEGSSRQDETVEILWASNLPKLGPLWFLAICVKINISIYNFLSSDNSSRQDGSVEILRSSNGLFVQELWTAQIKGALRAPTSN